MEENEKVIIGETGEILTPFTSVVRTEGEDPHVAVAIDVDGYTVNEDGVITILLSPSDAKRLCVTLSDEVDTANYANYNLLRHKAPF